MLKNLHNIDCIEYMQSIPNETFDLIIADPPYFKINGEFDYVWDSVESYILWSKKWIQEAHRVLKTTGSFYLWGKIGFGNGFPLFKICDWFENENLFTIRNWITQKNSRGRGTKRGYMEAREELIFATKSDDYIWNPVYTSEKSKRTDKGADGKPRKNKYKRASDVWICFSEASQSSKQRFYLSDGSRFPTVKSLDLCERILKGSSMPGNYVYIPFGGSGSEAVACQNMGLKWELTESNQQYFEEIIIPRISKNFPELSV